MSEVLPKNWADIHYTLYFCIAAGQIVVIYLLNRSTIPPRALGVYTIYFFAAALCGIAILLQLSTGTTASIDIGAIATHITVYLLFLASAERAEITTGRLALGAVCLCACLTSFFLDDRGIFFLSSFTVGFFLILTIIFSVLKCTQSKNLGDAVVGAAAAYALCGIVIADYLLYQNVSLQEAKSLTYVAYRDANIMVFVGFMIGVLSDYQQQLLPQATEDSLTGLLNHKGMVNAVNVSLAVAAREDLSTSALMVDIDHFSKLNDNFGEETGRQVIQRIAGILARTARASDVIARVAYQEYLLILPGTSLESSRVLAERIRATIDDQPLLVHHQPIDITVSLGIACTQGAVNLDNLTRAAERAMYLAKRGGRNRVASVEHKPVVLTPENSRA